MDIVDAQRKTDVENARITLMETIVNFVLKDIMETPEMEADVKLASALAMLKSVLLTQAFASVLPWGSWVATVASVTMTTLVLHLMAALATIYSSLFW